MDESIATQQQQTVKWNLNVSQSTNTHLNLMGKNQNTHKVNKPRYKNKSCGREKPLLEWNLLRHAGSELSGSLAWINVTTKSLWYQIKDKKKKKKKKKTSYITIKCWIRIGKVPLFNNFGIRGLGRVHELRDKIAEDTNENHNHRERDQNPVSDCCIKNQIFRHSSTNYNQISTKHQIQCMNKYMIILQNFGMQWISKWSERHKYYVEFCFLDIFLQMFWEKSLRMLYYLDLDIEFEIGNSTIPYCTTWLGFRSSQDERADELRCAANKIQRKERNL